MYNSNNQIKKNIYISPFSKPLRNEKYNSKNLKPEKWDNIVKIFKDKNFNIFQIGQGSEYKIKNVDTYIFDKNFWDLKNIINNDNILISVDNFFPHFVNYINFINSKKNLTKMNVIWSKSNPNIYGYKYNNNIFKNEKYFRSLNQGVDNQFSIWEYCEYDENSFLDEETIVNKILEFEKNKIYKN